MSVLKQHEPPKASRHVFRPMNLPLPFCTDRPTNRSPTQEGKFQPPDSPSSSAPIFPAGGNGEPEPSRQSSFQVSNNRRSQPLDRDSTFHHLMSMQQQAPRGSQPMPTKQGEPLARVASPRLSPIKPQHTLRDRVLGRRSDPGSFSADFEWASTSSGSDSPRFMWHDSLTIAEWVLGKEAPWPAQDSCDEAYRDLQREEVEFPVLDKRRSSTGTVSLISPELSSLNYTTPTEQPHRGASGQAASEEGDGYASDDYSSSVDMPCDVSLNNTVSHGRGLSQSLSGVWSEPGSSLSTSSLAGATVLPGAEPQHYSMAAPDASPLAREPPLAQMRPAWGNISSASSRRMEQRLRAIRCRNLSARVLIGRVRALEEENRNLREQLREALSAGTR